LTGQYGVQTYFFIRKFNEINMYVWSYSIKIIVYSRASSKNKSTFSLVKYIWHILESNVTLQKVGFKNYLHLKKSTWNLVLQCKIKKLMHNHE
jgi:hypothetical protein